MSYRVAFTNLACPEWTIEEAASAAVDYGYGGLEMRLLDGEVIAPDLPAPVRRRVREVADEAGLSIICLDTSLRVSRPQERLQRDSELYCRTAAEWGAPYLRVFGGDPKVGLDAEGRLRAVEQLRLMAEVAEGFGVTVLLETHDLFAASPPVAEVLAAVDHPNAGALWDTLHPWRVGESAQFTLTNLQPWLRLVHVKDGVRRDDGSADLRLLGEGDVPMAEILGGLDRVGYEGWLSVEWERKWHPELDPPEIALPAHIEALRELGAVAE